MIHLFNKNKITRTINLCWNFGLEVWKARNSLAHEQKGGVSKLIYTENQTLIQALYDRIKPQVAVQDGCIFETPLADRLNSTYTVQTAWLECVKQLHQERYAEIVQEIRGKAQTEAELELRKLHETFLAELKKKKKRRGDRRKPDIENNTGQGNQNVTTNGRNAFVQ